MTLFNAKRMAHETLAIGLLAAMCASVAIAGEARMRVVAANLTGNSQRYETPGLRILKALEPDLVLIQEFRIGAMPSEKIEAGDIDAFVRAACGPDFHWIREPSEGEQIPNGIISRWPILESGEWVDPLRERDMAWAKIDVPGDRFLWAVSVHFSASKARKRVESARILKEEFLKRIHAETIAATDYLLVGGDLNTNDRGSSIQILDDFVVVAPPYPGDQAENNRTNNPRSRQYDWILANPALDKRKTPVVIGSKSFPHGLVFDSRITKPYSLLPEVNPAAKLRKSDSNENQHMAVVRDFLLPDD